MLRTYNYIAYIQWIQSNKLIIMKLCICMQASIMDLIETTIAIIIVIVHSHTIICTDHCIYITIIQVEVTLPAPII